MKAKTHLRPSTRHRPNGAATFDTAIESARQMGSEARAAAMDQFVTPAMQAMRDTGHQIEQGCHEAMDYVDGRLKQMETSIAQHPLRALACAVGAGVLIGFWLGRK